VQNSGLVALERDLLLTLNHRVVGSIPTQPTSFTRGLPHLVAMKGRNFLLVRP